MLLQGITWGTNAVWRRSRTFPELMHFLGPSWANWPAFPSSPFQAHGKVAVPCWLEMRSGCVTSYEYWLELMWHLSVLLPVLWWPAMLQMVEVPSAGSLGVEWQEQGTLPSCHGHGAQVRNYLCDVKALKFQGCYHCIISPVLTNIPPFPGTDRVQVMSSRKRYKGETYGVAQ